LACPVLSRPPSCINTFTVSSTWVSVFELKPWMSVNSPWTGVNSPWMCLNLSHGYI
jgi:hypothetical protein